jgi:hypothetical protein
MCPLKECLHVTSRVWVDDILELLDQENFGRSIEGLSTSVTPKEMIVLKLC